MKMRKSSWLTVVAVMGTAWAGFGQGTFQNLDFETAALHVSPTPLGGGGGPIDPAAAFFGWVIGGSGSGAFQTATLYNDVSIGGSAVTLVGPAFPNGTGYNSLQGSYTALLQRSFGGAYSVFMGQTGQIPQDARSLFFMGSSDFVVTFAGQQIPLVQLGSGAEYTLLGGDIFAFRGQAGELRFTVPAAPGVLYGGGLLDDIQFSGQPIPEPCAFTFAALAVLLFGWRQYGSTR
jgi:hypothetical protein